MNGTNYVGELEAAHRRAVARWGGPMGREPRLAAVPRPSARYHGDPRTTPLFRRRRELGLSLEAVAVAVGVQWQAIQQWEAGRTSPRLEFVGRLAAALRCSVGEVVGWFVPSPAKPSLAD